MGYEPYIFYNGKFINTTNDEVTFPIEERAFQFGDGIYEVIRLYNGEFFTITEHLDRLYRSLKEIRLEIEWNQEELIGLLKKLVLLNDFSSDGQVYLQVSRGNAPRNHIFPSIVTPNLVAYVKKAERPLPTMSNGVAAYLADDIRWLRCDIKSLNLLPNVLAKQSAVERGGYEAIFHRNGTVTECSSSNVYMVKDHKVYTHPSTNLILNGITRQQIKLICVEYNIPFIEEAFKITDIFGADELFLSSTTSEITPITSVDGILIGKGEVGTLTKKLQILFEEHAKIQHRENKIKH